MSEFACKLLQIKKKSTTQANCKNACRSFGAFQLTNHQFMIA